MISNVFGSLGPVLLLPVIGAAVAVLAVCLILDGVATTACRIEIQSISYIGDPAFVLRVDGDGSYVVYQSAEDGGLEVFRAGMDISAIYMDLGKGEAAYAELEMNPWDKILSCRFHVPADTVLQEL